MQIFCPVKETNRTHSKGYVEDLSTQRVRKRYAKMAVLNLSVLPIVCAMLKCPLRQSISICLHVLFAFSSVFCIHANIDVYILYFYVIIFLLFFTLLYRNR